ncbi:MAG: FAD-dependent oxidoreductase [Mailhella sp.]|nr:FAD-dependent oxidoreductase [Mailhella sp.]
MSLKILVIGGVALGPKAAARAKRLMPEADITMIDQGTYISYGGCGIPYYVGGDVAQMDGLRTTNAGVVRDEAFFMNNKGVKAICHTRALSINRKDKTVLVENTQTGEQSSMPYDKLVIATGSSPRIPPIPGNDLKNVTSVTCLEAAQAIQQQCAASKINHAVIIGAGFIGLEMAVALADMWGIKVTVIEMMDQVLPAQLCTNYAQMAKHDLEELGVTVLTSESVKELKGDENGAVCQVVTNKRVIDADQVIFSIGVTPNSQIAADAGLLCHPRGGIMVNSHLQTSDPDIYAGGDVIVTRNLISGDFAYLPLGSMANRQGRVIGTNIVGGQATFEGVVGSWCVKLNQMHATGAGLTLRQAKAAGFDAVEVSVEAADKAHFYPDHTNTSLNVVVDKKSQRVLGIQGMSADGSAVKARTDAVAAMLQIGRPTINDLSNLEVCYAPPFASAMDVVNTVGNVADNLVRGQHNVITPDEFVELWDNRAENGYLFVDFRPAAAGKPIEERHPGEYLSLPLEDLRERQGEIPTDRPVALVCNTGTRAYEAQLMLREIGIEAVNSAGGFISLRKRGDDVKF